MEARPAAGVGPRLPGRITAELIMRSPQYMSCIKQYEVDLRGNKIAAIENLGATQNQFDSIDLSDNAIVRLDGFPKLLRLKQLLMNNNRVARIARGLEEFIPNLDTLILTNNRINNLQDIDPLATLLKLEHLSLHGNPVMTKANYRLYVISKLPRLKVLDFKKVKQKERDAAKAMFSSEEAQATHASKTFEPDEDLAAAQQQAGVVLPRENGGEQQRPEEDGQGDGDDEAAKATAAPSQEQLIAIKAAIANAQTLEEIQRLEEALKTGHLPSEIRVDGVSGKEAVAAAPAEAATGMEVDANGGAGNHLEGMDVS
ncbi:hypothetical protein VOLCADRAFT_104320 [Volvox carteri f. nagariensis]|uniref:U2A'/phosphoprotein 32 family A C-terminal domain-containing protein n=1 Tax=Volvox carteri f. nagariensis TaxID=3068 RepID=D8TSW2_VOLCA|nr:uncharacterized protein VOLCADRAFT_104320 [Volvox carteri f. nagariensis]EFJ49551.1 hypothetical protein VOLCADRAFT_104320 [Volvox carteri f. nagariensis]|eukprot:XP_002949532.1 hypothetical protein VOLCADRAFT_104320 [Volvox carteri f. nagariensis]